MDLRKYSPNTAAIPPMTVPRSRISCAQPKRKAGSRPQASRRYTYQPPVCGRAAESSATDSAPHSEMTPPASHTPSMASGSGTRAAMLAGVRKMPEPMARPTTTPIALQNPSRRASVVDGAAVDGRCHQRARRPTATRDRPTGGGISLSSGSAQGATSVSNSLICIGLWVVDLPTCALYIQPISPIGLV